MVGETLGHYRILDRLGGGGMGDVYRAEDTQLGRQVALKVLRPELAASPERRQRFEREARALAALTHPHIVTVHSVEHAEGVDFLTMELVRGKPLSRLIPKGGLPLGELLALALPLTDAVAAAHAHGITHRDLKPDNVMVDEEGRVKVLDFGLAKLKQELAGGVDSRLPTQSATGEGRIVGTVAYMSPEQAEGRPVDPRSDVFSLGVVLYEMATGERPFRGESSSALLASILKDTPAPVTTLRPELPRELGRILRRALAKDPEERIQTAKELRAELRELKADLDSGDLGRPASRPSRKFPRKTVSLVFFFVILLGAAAVVWWRGSRPQPVSLTALPVTTDVTVEREIALSPDGNLLAFTRRDGDSMNLYVRQIGGGEALRIAQGLYGGSELSWSPDGREIACSRQIERDGRVVHDAIVAVPLLGGAERQLTTTQTSAHSLAWSPDGRWLAITDTESAEEPDGIFLVSLETGEKRRLTSPPVEFLWGDLYPRFSPDGRWVAFLRASDVMNDIYIVSVDGGEPQRLTSGNRFTDGLGWAPDGRSLIFSSTRGRAGFAGLWRVPAGGGDPEPLSFGEHASALTISRRGRRLAYRRHQIDTDVWRLAGRGAGDDVRTPERFLSSTWWDFTPQYSPDGRWIAFTSRRSGYNEIWVADAAGTSLRQLTFLEDPYSVAPSWSPDGREIAFHSSAEGSYDVYVVSAAGGVPRRITTDAWPRNEVFPSWSSDGQFVYFVSNRDGHRDIWKVPAEGGEATQVTHAGGAHGVESPDGQLLYYSKFFGDLGPEGLWRRPLAGGDEEQVLEHIGSLQWGLCEEGIAFFDQRGASPSRVIAFYDFSTRQVQEMAPVEAAGLWGLSASPDCRWILYSPVEFQQSDIMLVEGFR